jgi:hypothetical protein
MQLERAAGGIKASQIPIEWNESFSIFASEPFLSSVSDEYGWIGGHGQGGRLVCVLPYTVIKKANFRLVRFRVETIPISEDFCVADEKEFLNQSIEYFKGIRADIIIPATTNSIFRTYPDGAIAAPYGTFIIDLKQTEDEIWRKMNHTYRKDIQNAGKKGLSVRVGSGDVEKAHALIRDTFKRSGLSFMDTRAFKRLICGLGEHVMVFWAESEGTLQSTAVFPYSTYCAYGVYGGSVPGGVPGAFKLIQWEAIKLFRGLGVQRYDLVGSRVNPEKGSKQEGLMLFKKHFGAEWVQGYIWKYQFSRWKYQAYRLATQLRRGGDIVDLERHKLVS